MTKVEELIQKDADNPKCIMFVGDVMTDVYVHGTPAPCQENCLKLVEELVIRVPGGSANAVRSLRHWNVKKIAPFDLATRHGPIKTRFMDKDECLLRHDWDHYDFDLNIPREVALQDLEYRDIDAVLISDYCKGALTDEFIRQVIELCTRRSIPCVVDAKQHPIIYKGAILKANETWSRTYGHMGDVVTRGSEHPVVRGKTVDKHMPDVTCVNHVGAGDCFAAHLVMCMAYGFNLAVSACIAHSAGRVYVQGRHNMPPTPNEVRKDALHSAYALEPR